MRRSVSLMLSVMVAATHAACGTEEAVLDSTEQQAVAGASVYADGLGAGWSDWSWAAHDLASASPVASGTRAISVDYGPWTGLYLHHAGVPTAALTHLELSVNGGSVAGKALWVCATVGGTQRTKVALAPHCAGGTIPANAWTRCRVPLSALGVANATIDGIQLQEAAGRTLSRTHLDDIAFAEAALPPPPPPPPPPPAPSTAWLYRDAMVSPWVDSSWAPRDLASTALVANGTRAISARMGPWQAVYFTRAAFVPAGDASLTFLVNGGSSGAGVALRVRAVTSGNVWNGGVDLGPRCEGGSVPAGRWVRCTVPMSALAPAGVAVTGLAVQEWRGATLPTIHLDDFGLLTGGTTPPPPPPPPPPVVTVAISPSSAAVEPGGAVPFTASVTGTTNVSVSWSVAQGAAGGSIAANGLYTAPATSGSYEVVATSAADATATARATVVVGSATPPPLPGGPVDRSVVPADRRTVWNPGVPGGVPPDDANPASFPEGIGPASVHATLSPSGGDDTGAIQSALNAAGATATRISRRVVKLSAGTFRISSLTIPSYVILRGTLGSGGARQTVLNRPSPGSTSQIWIGRGSAWGTVRNLVGTHAKGASRITVDDASPFQAGDILSIDQVRDGTANGPSSGVAVYDPPNPGNWVWNLSSLWYQRQPYSAGHGVEWMFPDSSEWRLVSQRVEVLAKSGNTLTIHDPASGRGSPLHVTYYMSPQVYRSAGATGDVTRYAGVEDLVIWPNGTTGQRVVGMHQAAFSWVKNIEIDGTRNTWSGRHVELYAQTYRCEIRDSYFHGSSNYNQGGNAYGIDYQGSEALIENNVVRELNKPIVAENSGGGNVIAYNYVDEAVIGTLTNSWQEAAISTHASFSHSDLFEGNHTPNMGSDATHGNNGWITMFRNWATGQNSSGYARTYRRAVFSDGWNREMTSIGNVLWQPGATIDYLLLTPSTGANPVYNGPTSVYLLGSNAWAIGTSNKPGADHWDNGQAASLFHRHLDYDYKSNARYDNPANPVKALPPSLYLSAKPAFFGDLAWPWVEPGGATHADRVKTLPAKARYDAGRP